MLSKVREIQTDRQTDVTANIITWHSRVVTMKCTHATYATPNTQGLQVSTTYI